MYLAPTWSPSANTGEKRERWAPAEDNSKQMLNLGTANHPLHGFLSFSMGEAGETGRGTWLPAAGGVSAFPTEAYENIQKQSHPRPC